MADFTNGFWNIYIIVLSLLGIIGCGVLLYSQSKVKSGRRRPRRRTRPRLGRGLEGTHTRCPRWCDVLFYSHHRLRAAYLFLYPGLGLAGSLG